MKTSGANPSVTGNNFQTSVCDCRCDEVNDITPSPPQTTLIAPIIETLSLRVDEQVHVSGRTSARRGSAEAFTSMGTWRGFADINSDGTFYNINLPVEFLEREHQVRVRVIETGPPSEPVVATSHFVHPRSLLITPTATKQADQAFYNWRLQWADYQPTGYRLPPNTKATIVVYGDVSELIATLGIQGLAKRDDRTQQTENMREVRLQAGRNEIMDAIGGVLHIRNNGRAGCRIILDEHFVPIPYFVLNTTHENAFSVMLERSDPLSEIQLVGDRLTVCAYADTFNLFKPDDIANIVTSHETVLELAKQASGMDGSAPLHTRSTMWIHAVESASSKAPHATTGYIALPHGRAPGHEYMSALLSGQAHKQWVTLHEYGHHFQNQVNGIAFFSEQTVNIYALAVRRTYNTDAEDQRWPALVAWLARPVEEKHYHESPDNLGMFEQLRRGFSDDFLPRWDRYVREHPCTPKDLTGFTTSMSVVANFNLASFFAEWGVIKPNDATWQALQALGLRPVPPGLLSLRPYV